jgi:hypothetical protein
VRGGNFLDKSRAQQFRGARKQNRSAPAQGTPQAGKRKNQIRRAQSRAYSAVPVTVKGDAAAERIEFAGLPGQSQATAFGASIEIGFCVPIFCSGTAGVVFAPGELLASQHAM